MEKLGPIFDLGKMIWAPISEYYNYHKNAGELMKNLKRKRQELECGRSDIELKMGAELFPGKRPKKEVQFWLQKVETIDGEIETIEQEAGRVKYSNARIGKIACKKIQEVEELMNQRGRFGDSFVVDPPISRGDVLPITTIVGESTAKRTLEKIREHVLGEDFRKIGVYGMGGIGKTTVMKEINNCLLKETDRFDNVIWVTASKASNVFKLQNDIACKLELNLSSFKDETTRASKLYVALENRKRYVLILDDMWEAFRLEDIGIPEPTLANGCKMVLTTRDVNVCDRMNCKNIKMKLLSKDESWNLFLDIVGHDVLINNPNLKAIVEEVVKECARLPLAIITIAGSFKNVVDVSEWRNALEELRTSIKEPNNVATTIFERLQFSYERLKDEKLQLCLLYCALYPEDYEIDRDELIEHLIDEGVIKRMKSRQVEFDKGHTMLNKLENVSLLEGGSDNNKYFVKMHDLIRDMALQIAGPKFMVELEDFQDEEKWGKDLVKVSLMRNSMFEFPYISPMCPKLSTLLLNRNNFHGSIPDSFFVHLHGLNVLDLSHTLITSLPNSVSDLENLTTLRLMDCKIFTRVPSLAKLTALRKLDLSRSRIKEIPHGLEMLINLRYLSLDARDLEKMPLGILPKLTQLQVLKFHWLSNSLGVNGEEIVKLKRLEHLKGRFYDINHFNTYVGSLEKVRPITISNYSFFVGKRMMSHILHILSDFDLVQKCKLVILYKCNISLVLLPKDVQTLVICRCDNLRSSLDASFLKHAKELKSIYIWGCKEIGDTLSLSYLFPLQSLEYVDLPTLDILRIPFGEKRVASAPVVTLDTFSRLKKFTISDCPNIKKLFTLGLLLNLGNLEEIDVFDCEQLEEIIGGVSDDEVEEEAEEIEETGMGSNVIFPKLRKLKLWDLPELKTICSSSNVIVFDSPLQLIEIFICPKLKRLPFSLRLTNGQPSSPPSSLRIEIMKEEWELLEWDNHDTKNILEPRCLFKQRV
jgi:disease resistance protein RPS2